MPHYDKPARVLLADDQPIVLYALANLLQTDDHLLVTGQLPNLDQLYESTTPNPANILITDVWFESQLCWPLVETLRQRHPDLKMILFTEERSPELVRRAYQGNIEGYVLKSDSLENIRLAVHTVADGRPSYSPQLIDSLLKTPAPDEPSIGWLTPKEQAVLRQYVKGLMPKEFAASLGIKPSTAETHIRNIKQTLGFQRNTDLLRWAWQQGL